MEWKEEHDVLLCHEILVSQPFKFKERTVERGKMWDDRDCQSTKAWVALETKVRQVCFDNQKIRQIPVIS